MAVAQHPVPEQYFLLPTKHSPNNTLPALVYRNVLPVPYNEATTTDTLTNHNWIKKGTWGPIKIHHFHPNTHECYGVFAGSSTLLLGRGKKDTSGGCAIFVSAGDVIVIPAGTSHCSIEETSEDYKYIGVYPEGAPNWRNELGKAPVDHDAFGKEIRRTAIPEHDPVSGKEGYLPKFWHTARGFRSKL